MATIKYGIVPHSTTYNVPISPAIYDVLAELNTRLGRTMATLSGIETSSEEMAARITAHYFGLSRPEVVRNTNDVSFFLFGIQKHPNPMALSEPKDDTALVIDMDFTHHVHANADATELAALYTGIGLNGGEIATVLGNIAARAGVSRIPMTELVTAGAQAGAQDQATLEAAGWFEQLGENLITDPSFATPGDWTTGLGWTVGGTALCDGAQVSASDLVNTGVAVEAAKEYRVTYRISAYSAGNVQAVVGGITTSLVNTVGAHSEIVTSVSTASPRLKADTDFAGTITDFSVTEVIADPV